MREKREEREREGDGKPNEFVRVFVELERLRENVCVCVFEREFVFREKEEREEKERREKRERKTVKRGGRDH